MVVTSRQTKGRGQVDAQWCSQPNNSLTLSVFKRFEGLHISHQWYVSMAVSLAVFNTLKHFKIPEISIKWPNDIMSRSKKMAGILIENQIKQGNVVSSIIGLGINVNEEKFESLPQATSMLLATGNKYDLNEVLQSVIEEILIQLNKIEKGEHLSLIHI